MKTTMTCLGAFALLLLTLPPAVQAHEPAIVSLQQMFTFKGEEAGVVVDPQEPVIPGFSRLVRHADRVYMSISTRNLPAGAYTSWWILYNSPENCQNPAGVGGAECNEPDLGNPDVNGSAVWAIGDLVGPDGVGHFSACLGMGLDDFEGFVLFGNGLQNPQGAEIHVVVKLHGPVDVSDPLLLGQQLTTLPGTSPPCNPANPLPDQCPDPQITIMPAP